MATTKLTPAQRRALVALAEEPRTAIDLYLEYRVGNETIGVLFERGLIEYNVPPLRGLHYITDAGRAALEAQPT